MAKGAGRGGRVVHTRRRGNGGWRRKKGSKARRGGSSDGTSDEEFIVVEDEDVEDDGSSYDSLSDASQEEPEDSESTSYTEEEEEEEEEYDVSDDEEPRAATGRQPRKGAKSEAKPLRRRKSKPRPRRRHRIRAEDEEDEYEEEDDEDFAPDGDEDQSAKPPARKTGGRNKGPVKRRSKARNATKRGRTKKAPVKKRKRSSVHSSDDDFVVKDGALVERADRKKRRKKGVSNGKKRRSRAPPSDMLDSESSDFDYRVSEEELRDLLGGELGTVSPATQGKGKGKGKEILESEKQICGICLSEEQKGAVRGLLDCCTHYFCFDCIMEWSKMESRCPLCKQRFKTVSQSTSSGAVLGLRAAVKRIPKRDQVYQPSEEEVRNHQDPYADIVCMECQRGGDDHLMLLCDICDSPAHTYCVGRGREVPEGNWYCDDCRPINPGSSNPHVQESNVEYGTRNTDSLLDNCGENDSVDVTKCMPHETTGQLATQPSPRQTVSGDGQGASSGCHSSLGVQGTSSLAPGFAASTVSRRRSIHERIRTMLFNNRVGRIPDGVTQNVIAQPSSVQSEFYSFETEQSRETFHMQEESLANGINERSNRSFLAPRGSMHPCTHNQVTGLNVVEGTKSQVQSMVKNHLKCLTRDNSLERREFKDIARRATHTILAACGVQHRESMVSVLVRPPSSCGHQGDGELADLVKDCCSSCFSSFVGNLVRRLVNSRLRPT